MTPAWNWKTALWSGVYRAPAFFIAGWKSGLSSAFQAAGLEFLLFAALCGFTGALTQRFRHARPAWKARMLNLALIPAILHAAEWTIHALAATPGRGKGVLISMSMTILAVAFNWYAMRRGALLAGQEGGGLLDDIRQMPALLAGFAARIAGRGR